MKKTVFLSSFLLALVLVQGQLAASVAKQDATVFNVLDYGAVGDGNVLDTDAIQKAIDEAEKVGNGAKVLVPKGHQFLIGTLVLKSDINFHLEGDAQLIVSDQKEDYSGEAAIIANGANQLTISGTGSVQGRALEFMSHYEEENEWWIPKEWRPKLFILTECKDLHIQDITIEKAPHWTLHMLGCEDVLIEGIKINNNLDVPNCDGIDPDHCRNVEIRNCQISCGDDAIVVKATRQEKDYGPSANIWVHDCVLETQDSGVKIGTETTQDIFDIVFERCKITTSCRGLTIQLRDEGSVYNILFKDIDFVSRYHSAPWWGRGEAISFTAIPRNPGSEIGTIHNVIVKNVTGKSENSVRINGTKESRISNIRLEDVHITMDRWTDYPGNLMDNRPTKSYPAIEYRDNPGYYIRFADNVELLNCSMQWGENIPDNFTHAIEAHDVSNIQLKGFKGTAAHPERDKAIKIEEHENKDN
ncbi:glycoside hydrolase family 28 protein [Sunxiuqinia indica]|uniref:glycoside hydrolase family 28 protein n=1 Tax=Sunxiuqinia indica TaxID=2692584 RepID=UPI001356AED9|nr:glycosyl hydrolase family 28 protein [Sunxiuqinia indica]